MKYFFDSRVRYSEIDSDKKMTLIAVLDYFQDCSIFHSESLGIGLDYLEENQKAWILSSWQVEVNRYPILGEQVRVSTWAYDFKGFYGYRNFKMEDASGETLAYANSIWVFMDTQTGRPSRLTEEVGGAYEIEAPLQMDCDDRKIRIDSDLEERAVFPVQRFHIDTNQHVNNEKYVLMAEEFLPENFAIRKLRVEYRKSAVLSDQIYVRTAMIPGGMLVVLGDEQGKPYAIVEFLEDCK